MSAFFFFQAEDGIRDIGVTGVQTCALPIPDRLAAERPDAVGAPGGGAAARAGALAAPRGGGRRARGERAPRPVRSGERRVGEEGRTRGSPHPLKKKKKEYYDYDTCVR